MKWFIPKRSFCNLSYFSDKYVIEAVARLAMPKVNFIDPTTKGILINHQWGYTKNYQWGGHRGIIIEDRFPAKEKRCPVSE